MAGMREHGQSYWTFGAAALAAFTVTAAPATAQGANDPIGIAVTSALEGQKGIGRILSAAGSGDVADTARDIERLVGNQRWARLVSGSPEVVITIHNRERIERRRSYDKKGNLSIEHRYSADGTVEIDRRRSQVHAELDFTEGQYSTRNDSDQFEKVAEKLWTEIAGIVLSDLNALRPDRPEAGFDHAAKYKLLVKGDGLEVRSVDPGSPAEQAGLQVKDRIRRIDDEKGTSQMDYRARTWWVEAPGTRVSLEYERDKARQTVQITLMPRREWGGGGAPVAAAPPAARPVSATTSTAPAKGAASGAKGASSGSSSGVELKPGMTELEVSKLLGPPKEKVAFGAKSLWRYDGYSITFQNGRVIDMK
jgi:PDZ domain-containing protein